MRAVLSLFLSALLWATACAYAQTDEVLYQIDEQATAKAPWTVGDIVAENIIDITAKKMPPKIYRKFIGVTNQGYFVVQDFYQKNNKKAINPIAIIQEDLVTDIEQSDEATPFDGLLIRWYDSGEKASELLYKYGKAQGFWTSWYKNGNKSGEVQYQNGKRQGNSIFWYDNRQISLVSQYQDGLPQGFWTEWYGNGEKREEGEYQDGKRQGLWTDWYDNGKKMQEGEYRDGKQEGLWTSWRYEGKKIKETVYEAGQVISEKTFD